MAATKHISATSISMIALFPALEGGVSLLNFYLPFAFPALL